MSCQRTLVERLQRKMRFLPVQIKTFYKRKVRTEVTRYSQDSVPDRDFRFSLSSTFIDVSFIYKNQ